MKTIIAGSREIMDYATVRDVVNDLVWNRAWDITEVVSGGAKGVDQMGETWANRNHVPIKQFIPDWNGYAGMRAGLVRNSKMADYADALIAIWNGHSTGTEHMIRVARERGLKVHVEIVNG
jgi:hypothetical protein